ncbi:MAG: class I SAM-dependent methyltransferase [Acholeplasmatales bacterium]|nr:class I SAM-dependent methyltransferase [Acholeplasmatales bacterium]
MANLIYDYYRGKDLYSDGDIEDEILKLLEENKPLEKLLETDKRWAFQYHLNPNRDNLLSVCDIKSDDYCLEIGSGLGAISTGILKYTDNLDAVELSKKRSLINQLRNKDKDNFNIYVGNFNDVKLDKKYDKIFLIGVLEYARLYFPNEENPFMVLLKKVKSYLKKGGELFIAIENKYGMKYFSGATEDHSGVLFEGIVGYENKKATTFSKNELKELILESGYEDTYFYYPLPDYKFPEEIYSEDYLPNDASLNMVGRSYDRNRYVLFSEIKALKEASRSNDFETFANSFLVRCR